MIWQDFLEKVSVFKKDYRSGQVTLNVGSLATLIYSGAFDYMVTGKPDHADYRRMAEEIKNALGSTAKPQKAKKGEIYGIEDIDSDLLLDVWRRSVNPLYQFDFISKLKGFIEKEGFVEFDNVKAREVLPYIKKSTRPPYALSTAWSQLFEDPDYRSPFFRRATYDQNGRPQQVRWHTALIGLVVNAEIKKIKGDRDSLVFQLNIGAETTGPIRVWPNEHGFVPYEFTSTIKKGAIGLAYIKIDDSWNNMKQATLDKWTPVQL
jgi:hypothetical protein